MANFEVIDGTKEYVHSTSKQCHTQ